MEELLLCEHNGGLGVRDQHEHVAVQTKPATKFRIEREGDKAERRKTDLQWQADGLNMSARNYFPEL